MPFPVELVGVENYVIKTHIIVVGAIILPLHVTVSPWRLCTLRTTQSPLLPDHPLGEEVGELTSGAYSPNLDKNVAMGYVKKGLDKVGTKLKVVVRNKENPAEVAKVPFVPNRYYKVP